MMFFMRSNVLRWRGGGREPAVLKGERSAWGSPQQAVFGYQIRSLPTLCNADIIGRNHNRLWNITPIENWLKGRSFWSRTGKRIGRLNFV